MTGGWRPPAPIKLDGIPGIDVWPNGGYVSHDQPEGDVTLDSSQLIGSSRIDLIESSEVIESFDVEDHKIIINSDALTNAIGRKLTLRLYIDGALNDGYIIFLPRTEEIEFNDEYYIQASDGRVQPSSSFAGTGPIDVSNVTDIIYTGTTRGIATPLYAYGDDMQPVRSLLTVGSYDHTHIVPDGSYRYVRACAVKNNDYSLSVVYRDRGRH